MAQIYPNPNKVGSTISFTDGDFNSANFDNHGTLINNGSGTFTNKSGIISNTGKFSSIDMNSGITNKSGATISNSGHFEFYSLDNYSIINNNSGGTISLYGGGSLICQLDQCVINNNSGATFTIAEDWVAGGDHGEFDINGILNNNLGGTFNNNGNVSTERGDTAAGVINNNGTFNNNARLYNYYSTLTNNGIVNNKGIVENDMNGKFVNNSGATLNNIQSAQSGAYSALNVKSSFENSGTINNNATININGAGFVSKAGGLLNNHAFIYSDGIENAGTIFNYAIININGAGKGITNVGFLSNTGNLTNKDINSRILINAGSLINKGTITNNGLIDLLSGSSGPGSFSNEKGALLTGTGSTYGHIDNDGTINGGQSAGGYLIDGNLMHNAGGNKIIELGGRDDAERDRINTEHDFVDITGDLILDGGSLDVSLIDGFKLSAGDSFVITKVDGDLSGEYDGLNEGDSVGRFKSKKGGKLDLFLTYEGGDGNDIELYTKSFFSVLPDSLRDPRIIGSDDKDSLTGTSADEVIFGGSDDDVLLGGAGDDQVTGGNGNDKLDGGLGDDTLKGDRGADDYILSSGEDVYESFSIDENDQVVVGEGVYLSLQQVGDNLLIKGIAIHTTLLDVDKDEFLAADCIDFI